MGQTFCDRICQDNIKLIFLKKVRNWGKEIGDRRQKERNACYKNPLLFMSEAAGTCKCSDWLSYNK